MIFQVKTSRKKVGFREIKNKVKFVVKLTTHVCNHF